MSLPMLQVALDNQTMDSAYETTRLIAEEVDIIEVGTILCVGEGVRAVRDLKALYPHKIVLADAKIADAGKILSRMCFEANADWVTVICCADINTAKGALDVAKEFNGDVQIELTGYWTWEQAQQWRDAGIQQVVYHRSRDAQAAGVAWGKANYGNVSLVIPGASDKYPRWRAYCRYSPVPASELRGSTLRLAHQSLHLMPDVLHFQWRSYG